MKRKIFKFTVLACASLVMIAGLSACRTTKEKPVRFAIASDFHAPDIPDGEHRVATFIKAANDEKVDFIIELGDFCRLDSASQVYRDLWNSFPGSKYHVIGNHDMDRYTFEEYTQGMNMPARYYSFNQGDFHFIVLDGNNLFDGKKYTHYARANYYVDAKKRAHIDPEQMEWLKKDLAATNKRCILFSHQSIEEALNNGAEVRKILEAENQRAGFKKVVMAFGGHNHSNYSKEINGITYVQINSASYVWIGEPTQTEKRYSKEINDRFGGILKYSMTYTEPLYAIVTLNSKGATLKGTDAEFVPPTPKDLNMNDSVGVFPLVSNIKDLKVKF
ncbi:MAG: metallophosphoesterase [bacterium]|nr:metallophosphoesterase [bacterium]